MFMISGHKMVKYTIMISKYILKYCSKLFECSILCQNLVYCKDY